MFVGQSVSLMSLAEMGCSCRATAGNCDASANHLALLLGSAGLQAGVNCGEMSLGFTGCGKTRFRAALYQGTTLVVPISRLLLTRRADFSPRGVCNSDFFRSLFSREVLRKMGCGMLLGSADL